jgi:tetratricopeptide (TPR) repeat protein
MGGTEANDLKVIWLFPAGLLVGAALVYVYFSGGLTSSPIGPEEERGDETVTVPATGTADASPVAGKPPAELPAELYDYEVDPENAVTYWTSLAVVDAIAGRVERCRDGLAKAIEAGDDTEDIQKILGYLPEADRAGVLEWLIEKFPDHSFNTWVLSDLYVLAGESDKAFDLLLGDLKDLEEPRDVTIQRLVSIDPVRAASVLIVLAEEFEWLEDTLLHIAQCLIDEDQRPLARPFVLRALALDPSSDDAVELMTELDPTAALDLSRKAVAADPENPFAWARLADLLRKEGDVAGAFEAYRNAAQKTDDEDFRREYMMGMITTDPVAALSIVRTLAEGGDDETLGILGHAFVAARQMDAAYGIYHIAHTRDGEDSEWLHRMVALDPARAAREFQAELEDFPATDNDELVGTYALALESQGKLGDAFEQYLRAWRIDDEDWEWMRGMARSNPQRAAEILEDRMREYPNDGNTAGALGDAYVGLGRGSEAVRLYEQAINLGDDTPRWMAALATVEPARGLPMLKAAVEEDPEDDEMWGALGSAYLALGRMEEARKALDRALELDPTDWEWSVERERIR